MNDVRAAHPSRARRGFTLLELVVVIILIGILVAMLLPAINAPRGPSLKATCTNNLSQIGLALHGHLELHGSFPPGAVSCNPADRAYYSGGEDPQADCRGPNWMAAILDYMDEKKKAELLEDCLKQHPNVCADCPSALGLGSTTPKSFACPSDPLETTEFIVNEYGLTQLSKGNYAGNFGSDYFINPADSPSNGAFEVVTLPTTTTGLAKMASNRGVRLEAFTDGATKTILASEVLRFPSEADGRGAWLWDGMGGAAFTARNPPNARAHGGGSTALLDRIPLCGAKESDSGRVSIAQEEYQCAEHRTDGQTYASARSAHLGGVVVVFADRHVEFISDTIDPRVWQAMATRAGSFDEPEINTD